MRVDVPVPIRPEVPAELALPVVTEALPEFVEPKVPEASVALTPEGARRMRVLLFDLRQRILELEAFVGIERRPPAPAAEARP